MLLPNDGLDQVDGTSVRITTPQTTLSPDFENQSPEFTQVIKSGHQRITDVTAPESFGHLQDLNAKLRFQIESGREDCRNNPQKYLLEKNIIPIGLSEVEMRECALCIFDAQFSGADAADLLRSGNVTHDQVSELSRQGVWTSAPDLLFRKNESKIKQAKKEIQQMIRVKNGGADLKDDEWKVYSEVLRGEEYWIQSLVREACVYLWPLVKGGLGKREIDHQMVGLTMEKAKEMANGDFHQRKHVMSLDEHSSDPKTLDFLSWKNVTDRIYKVAEKRENREWGKNMALLSEEERKKADANIKEYINDTIRTYVLPFFVKKLGEIEFPLLTSIQSVQEAYEAWYEKWNKASLSNLLYFDTQNVTAIPQDISGHDDLSTFNTWKSGVQIGYNTEAYTKMENTLRIISAIERKTGRDLFTEDRP